MGWKAERGWRHVPDTEARQANGVAVSSNGEWIYYAELGSGLVHRISSDGSPPHTTVKVGGNPDNLSWTSRGTLLVATHTGGARFMGCAAAITSCRTSWELHEIDPGRCRPADRHPRRFRAGRGVRGTEARGTIYLGSVFDDRIGAIRPRPRDPPCASLAPDRLTALAWATRLGTRPSGTIASTSSTTRRCATRAGARSRRAHVGLLPACRLASFAMAGGGDPARFTAQIAANMAIHILCAWLLFLAALWAFGAPRGAAYAAALVFALHPVQADAVTYVSGRTDLLAALFSFAALLLHARARGWTGDPPRSALTAGAVGCYALAIGSKESALLLPAALLAGDVIFWRRSARGAPKKVAALLARMLPYALVLAGYGAWRAHLGGGTITIPDPETLGRTLPAALSAVGEYARLVLFPVNLHLERFVSASARPDRGAPRSSPRRLALACGAGADRF
jgi:hypothetical protein